jgi:hypothetical protein
MNVLGDLARRRTGLTFRKKLGMFNYKVKSYGLGRVRKPGVIPLNLKVRYLEV